jgi:hypothetical protein
LRTVPFTNVRRAILAVVLAVAAAPVAASGQNSPPTAWDGVNPFRCTVQFAGLGTEVPDPAADPYCVEFDKTQQNVTDLGVVDFLSKEPARVAAAVGKCFYFQSDHWRGSIVQDDGSTKTYEFDGHYFFDKAKGNGGAWVTNFNIAGQTFDPSEIPGIPPDIAQDLGPGTGGVITHDDIPADPACAARVATDPGAIYADTTPAGHTCVGAAGPITRRRLGPAVLGRRDAGVRAALGAPGAVRRGFLRYCADGGGRLLIGQPGDRSGTLGTDPAARTNIVLATSKTLLASAPPRAAAPRVFRHVVRLRHHVLAGVRHGRLRWLAVTAKPSRVWLRRALHRAGVRIR